MHKATKFLILAVTLLLCLSWAQLAKADNFQTIGSFSGPVYTSSSTFPITVDIGTFTILAGDTSATISGSTGLLPSPDNGTAPEDLYLGSVLLFTCLSTDPCYSVNGTTWSYTFSASDLTALGTGTVEFYAIQNAPYAVELGATTLDQAPGTAPAVPEPSTLVLLASGSLAFLGLALKKLV